MRVAAGPGRCPGDPEPEQDGRVRPQRRARAPGARYARARTTRAHTNTTCADAKAARACAHIGRHRLDRWGPRVSLPARDPRDNERVRTGGATRKMQPDASFLKRRRPFPARPRARPHSPSRNMHGVDSERGPATAGMSGDAGAGGCDGGAAAGDWRWQGLLRTVVVRGSFESNRCVQTGSHTRTHSHTYTCARAPTHTHAYTPHRALVAAIQERRRCPSLAASPLFHLSAPPSRRF